MSVATATSITLADLIVGDSITFVGTYDVNFEGTDIEPIDFTLLVTSIDTERGTLTTTWDDFAGTITPVVEITSGEILNFPERGTMWEGDYFVKGGAFKAPTKVSSILSRKAEADAIMVALSSEAIAIAMGAPSALDINTEAGRRALASRLRQLAEDMLSIDRLTL